MFYFIVNKMLSIINDDSRTMKVIIIGSMCYIILHAFLFSKYNENSEMIQKFREYIYYLFAADAALTGAYMWMLDKPKHVEDTTEEDADDENTTESACEKKAAVTNRPSITDVHKKLLELKAKQQQQQHSPFVTKTESKAESSNEPVKAQATAPATAPATVPAKEPATAPVADEIDDDTEDDEEDENIPTYKDSGNQKIKNDEDTVIPVFKN